MPNGSLNGWIGGTRNAPALPVLLPVTHVATYAVGPQVGAVTGVQPSDPHDLIIYGGHRTVTLSQYEDDISNIGTLVAFGVGEVYGALLLDRVAVESSPVVYLVEDMPGYRAQVIIKGFEVPRRINRRPTNVTVPAYMPIIYPAWFDFINGELILTSTRVDGLYWSFDPTFGIIIDTSRRGGRVILVDSSETDYIHLIVPT